MITDPQILGIVISFNMGLVFGAGVAWGLVMYWWEPIEAEETKRHF